MKKRLHHNGRYIADSESTGDDLKDVAIVQKILSERGLDATPTPEQAIFRQAVSFANTAADMFEKYPNKTPPDGSGMAPFVVNAVFTQDEMDDLPDDDPQEAFTRFVEIARRRLADYTATLGEEEADWHQRSEAQHGFMNVVIAAAKRFEIQPLATLSVTRDKIQFRYLSRISIRFRSLSHATSAQQHCPSKARFCVADTRVQNDNSCLCFQFARADREEQRNQ